MTELQRFRKQVRTAVADYIKSEGCGCCGGDDHPQHTAALAKLLNVRKYPDGSGYDFLKYRTGVRKEAKV